MHTADQHTPELCASRALWNSAKRGVLIVQERREPVGFVVGKGVLLVPACWGVGTLRPQPLAHDGDEPLSHITDATLHVPDEGFDALGLVIEARALHHEAIPSSQAALLDRWQAYHGRPGAHGFAVCAVEAARIGQTVVDGDDLELVSTLSAESRLLKALNADRPQLARAASASLGLRVLEPTAVGIDHWGIDLRTPVGVVRIAAGQRLTDATADAWTSHLLEGGHAA